MYAHLLSNFAANRINTDFLLFFTPSNILLSCKIPPLMRQKRPFLTLKKNVYPSNRHFEVLKLSP